MAATLAHFSVEDLEKLCVLAFWFGLGSDRAMEWGDSREEMELFLSGVPIDAMSRLERFLGEEPTIRVSDDHASRVAKLPAAVRVKAALVEPEAFAHQPEQRALAEVLSPEDSELLLRWATWSRAAAPPTAPPPSAPHTTDVPEVPDGGDRSTRP